MSILPTRFYFLAQPAPETGDSQLGQKEGRGVSSTSKHSARVECFESSIWISPRQFWTLVREEVVEYLGERPLTGRFRGRGDDFLITINHTLLDMNCPQHRKEVLQSKRFMKK